MFTTFISVLLMSLATATICHTVESTGDNPAANKGLLVINVTTNSATVRVNKTVNGSIIKELKYKYQSYNDTNWHESTHYVNISESCRGIDEYYECNITGFLYPSQNYELCTTYGAYASSHLDCTNIYFNTEPSSFIQENRTLIICLFYVVFILIHYGFWKKYVRISCNDRYFEVVILPPFNSRYIRERRRTNVEMEMAELQGQRNNENPPANVAATATVPSRHQVMPIIDIMDVD